MSAAVITIVVLLVIIAMLLLVIAMEHRERDAWAKEMASMHRSHQIAAEQSRAHARADERQWADDVPARIWRNK